MQKKQIIGLVGKISSGKGTVASYLEEKYQAHTYRFSTILRDILKRLHSEINRANMQNISTAIRQTLGEDILAKVIAEDVKKDDSPLIVVDGIRRMVDIKYLKELDGFILVKVEASEKTRYQRLIQRSENADDQKKTFEEFLKEQENEADAEIPLVMKNAQKTLNNEEDFNNLYNQIDNLISL